MQNARRQAGFSLALTMAVTMVLILLVGAVFADILSTQRGSLMMRQEETLGDDAQLALRMAESEIYRDQDMMMLTTWSATLSAKTDSYGSAPDNSNPAQPVKQLEFLGNARNWPAFCDWSYYLRYSKAPSGQVYSPDGGLSFVPGGAGSTPAPQGYFFGNATQVPGMVASDSFNTTGSATLEQDSAPMNKFDESDPCLTRGWWLVPRDDQPDDASSYFTSSSCPESGLTYPVAPGFPISFQGASSSDTAPAPVTSISYMGQTYNNVSIPVVPHDYWYDDAMPICGQTTTTTSIPKYAVWPNAWGVDADGHQGEYGDGACGKLNSNPYTYIGKSVPPGAAMPPQVFDTPIFKKIYTLEDGREVAVYARMDLRDYFAMNPAAKAYPSYPAWTQNAGGMHDSANNLTFYLVAVPEGRIDYLGNNQAAYRPAPTISKFVYFSTGGADLTELATSSDDLASQDAFVDMHQLPATLKSSQEYLAVSSSAATMDLWGQVFRGDGDRGFNWTSYKPTSGPIAQPRMVYLWEEQPNSTPASFDYYFLGVGGKWLNEYSGGTTPPNEAGWTIDR